MSINLTGKCCVDREACCPTTQHLNVDYLYLDLERCDRCQSTDQRLAEALELLRPVLSQMGYSFKLNKLHMDTLDKATKYHFLSSPTIRINDTDLFETVTENECGCCSEISGHQTACRTFTEEGRNVNSPSLKLLIERILHYVLDKTNPTIKAAYVLPENLKQFYEKKP